MMLTPEYFAARTAEVLKFGFEEASEDMPTSTRTFDGYGKPNDSDSD